MPTEAVVQPNTDVAAGTESPAPVETPASPEVDNAATLDIDDISSMLTFDPFEAKDDVSSDVSPGLSQEGEVPPADAGAAPAASEVPVTPEGDPAVPEVPQESPEVVLMRQQLAQQAQMIEQMQATATQAPTQASGGPAADPMAEFIPSYLFQVPQPIQSLLDSEDSGERSQGISHLMNGALRQVHRNMLEQVQGMMTTYVPQQLQQHSSQTSLQAEIKSDFYGANADLNTTEIRQLVSMLTPQVMQETGQASWSPALRDAIAAKARGMLGLGAPGTVAPAPAAPTPAPVQFGSGSRGPINSSAADDIMNTLF